MLEIYTLKYKLGRALWSLFLDRTPVVTDSAASACHRLLFCPLLPCSGPSASSVLHQDLCTRLHAFSRSHIACPSLTSFKALLKWLHVIALTFWYLHGPLTARPAYCLHPALSRVCHHLPFCLYIYWFSLPSLSPSVFMEVTWGQGLWQFCSRLYPQCLKQFPAHTRQLTYVLNE